MFFYESVFPMEGNGMEVQIKGVAPTEAQRAHGIKPQLEELGVAGRIDSAAVLREKGTLRDTVESRKQSETLIQNIPHHMRVARIAKELEGQQGAHRRAGGNHFGAGQSCLFHQLIEGDLSQIRQE